MAAAIPEIDVILFGHSHRELEGRTIGKVLVVQPRNWGMSLARVDLALEPGRIYVGTVPPLAVRYAIYEERRLVIIQRFRPLSGKGLDPDG